MPIDLTHEDRAAIKAALGERYPIDERDQAIYRAGLAAGRARAIEDCAVECDELAKTSPETREGYADSWSCKNCAAAIRDLNAPAAP